MLFCFFFFKQKTAYEIGTGDWSSDVCSSDLINSSMGIGKVNLALRKIIRGIVYELQPCLQGGC